MFSLAFLRKLKSVAQAEAQSAIAAQEAVITASSDPTAASGVETTSTGSRPPAWAVQSPGDVMTIVYDPITGKAYPNPSEARGAGVMNFSYNVPSGMNIDWSWWDKFKQPATTTPAPVPITVAPQEIDYTDPPTNPPADDGGDDGGQTAAPVTTQPPATTQPPRTTRPPRTTKPPTTTPAPTTRWVGGREGGYVSDPGYSTWQGEGDYGDDTSAAEQGGDQGNNGGGGMGGRAGPDRW